MVTVRPFQAVRPAGNDEARRVAALPYDVMDSDEARAMASGNPDSFLHVDKAEIDLDPSVDIYSDEVYAKAAENLDALIARGALFRDGGDPAFYCYRLTMGGRAQTGVVGCPCVDDYTDGRIKKHELTRADKEEDRVRHVDALSANTGPIFLAHRPDPGLDGIVAAWTAGHQALYDFEADGGVRHEVWKVDDAETVARISAAYAGMDALYIADGHHRCASAVRVAKLRRDANAAHTGGEEYNFFLAVIFPSDQLAIMDYNRVVKDLNHLTPDVFLTMVKGKFTLERVGGAGSAPADLGKHGFGMYFRGEWHRLQAKPLFIDEGDPVASLDAVVLQDGLLSPLLGIGDPRTDKRIDFVGGIRGFAELERRVDALDAAHGGDSFAVAFALCPVSMDDLLSVADAGLIMPPKSTWFEPKLLSGLFIHELG